MNVQNCNFAYKFFQTGVLSFKVCISSKIWGLAAMLLHFVLSILKAILTVF